MSDAVTALLAALVGAAAAIAGQWVTPVLTARRAHRAWVRDKRAALCEEFVGLLMASARRVNRHSLPTDQCDEAARVSFEDANEAVEREALRIVDLLHIYASPELYRALHDAASAHLAHASYVHFPYSDPTHRLNSSREASAALRAAYRAIRKELDAGDLSSD